METVVFLISAAIVLGGALGVILSRNSVHSALSLVATLFGIAVLFVAQDAQFLAAVQVIVYAGAIVVLFLFVIMLLGVDQEEDITTEPLIGQRPAAAVIGAALLALLTLVITHDGAITGVTGFTKRLDDKLPNINQLSRVLFTDYLYAFEITSVLLVIAVVGAVLLARRTREPLIESPPASDEEVVGR
jgi:NADH-quinone oxidoreductase subunit J